MATTICGWCGTNTHYTDTNLYSRPQGQIFHAYTCDECGGIIVGRSQPTEEPDEKLAQIFPGAVAYRTTWAPQYVQGQDFPDVPRHISEAASEAHKSHSIGSFKSAILMARTVVEATAKSKEIDRGSLYNKIDALANQNLIQEFTKETAHSIRQFGNDMAHGDIELPVDEEDVEMVLGFMDALLAEVFQTPARLAALQAKISARNP